MHIKDLHSAYFNAWNAHDCALLLPISEPSVGAVFAQTCIKVPTLAYGFHIILTRCMCVALFATK